MCSNAIKITLIYIRALISSTRSVLSFYFTPLTDLAIAFALARGKVEESESGHKLEHLIRSAVEVLCANKHREFLDKSDQFTYEMDCQLKQKIAALKESRCSTDSALSAVKYKSCFEMQGIQVEQKSEVLVFS